MQPHDGAQYFNCFITFKNKPSHRLAFRVTKISQFLDIIYIKVQVQSGAAHERRHIPNNSNYIF